MKILITGVYGIVGSELLKELEENHEILGIGKREKYDSCSHYIQCDLSNAEELEKIFSQNRDIEAIVHCAALAHNKGNDLSYNKFEEVNYGGTVNLVDLSNKYLNLKKFIFLSTISVYGEELNKTVYLEDDKCNPKSPYAVTKRMAEEYIQESLKADYSILRLCPVYTKEFTLNIDRRTKVKNMYYMVSGGKFKLSLCNVKNIRILTKVLLENLNVGKCQVYNVSDSKVYTYKDIIDVVAKGTALNVPKIFLKTLFIANKFIKSQFIHENTIKLMSDNIYSSEKANSLVGLKYRITDVD